MRQMIDLGKEILRINPSNSQKIEYSTNMGISWIVRYSGSSQTGEFEDIIEKDNEIIALTNKGTFYSRNKGITWIKKSN